MNKKSFIQRVRVPVPAGKVVEARTGDETACSHLEISLVYDSGGINYFTYKNDPRGYWVCVNPITINGSMLSLEFGRGVRALIAPVARQSVKARREAEAKWLDEAKNLIERYYTNPEVDFTTAKAA